jgi:hypothetical protein
MLMLLSAVAAQGAGFNLPETESGSRRTASRCTGYWGRSSRNDVREMLARENSGFSLDAAVRIAAHDRAGLERRLR